MDLDYTVKFLDYFFDSFGFSKGRGERWFSNLLHTSILQTLEWECLTG